MSEIHNLEKHLQNAKELADRRKMALKLSENREFKKLILDEFCTAECARYAQSSADPALKTEERADALAMAQAAGHLRRFLSVVVQMGSVAERDIPQLETAIEDARQEEVA